MFKQDLSKCWRRKKRFYDNWNEWVAYMIVSFINIVLLVFSADFSTKQIQLYEKRIETRKLNTESGHGCCLTHCWNAPRNRPVKCAISKCSTGACRNNPAADRVPASAAGCGTYNYGHVSMISTERLLPKSIIEQLLTRNSAGDSADRLTNGRLLTKDVTIGSHK